MGFKVAFVGAGSLGFTRQLVQDMFSIPEFRKNSSEIAIAFTDTNRQNLEMVTELVQRDLDANNLDIKIHATTDRREAFRDAKYVFCTIRHGGLEAFRTDIDIPLKYGIDQCVGDTLCAGGIMYGQRHIAELLEFCKDMRQFSAPDVLFLNYANPMAMNTWACNKYGGIKTIGLCHGVQHGYNQIRSAIESLINNGKAKEDPGYVKIAPKDMDITCRGINHQTWYTKVLYKGEDWTGRVLEAFETNNWFARTEKVRIDMIRRFGYYSTESNGHLSEYLPWYRKNPEHILDWIDIDSSWINGETGGYLRVCTEGRNWFETDFPNWMKESPREYSDENKSLEHGAFIVGALETGRVYKGDFNYVNNGCISNLADDAVIEGPAFVDRLGIHMAHTGDLPLGCAAVCARSIDVQRLAVEAAVHGDDKLLRQAMMMDPLVGAVCTPPEIWQMVDEMLVAQAQWLPQYGEAIEAAGKRLAAGNLLPTREGYQGAARVHTKTVEEMAKDKGKARRNAQEADKAKEQTSA